MRMQWWGRQAAGSREMNAGVQHILSFMFNPGHSLRNCDTSCLSLPILDKLSWGSQGLACSDYVSCSPKPREKRCHWLEISLHSWDLMGPGSLCRIHSNKRCEGGSQKLDSRYAESNLQREEVPQPADTQIYFNPSEVRHTEL